MTDDKIVSVPVGELKFWPGNPRVGDLDAIRESIEAHGVYKPLLVHRGTGRVMVGNNTLKAAVELGMERVPVVYKDVDDDVARRIMLVDNRTSDRSDYDEELLRAALLAVADDFSGTGYHDDDEDVAALLAIVMAADEYSFAGGADEEEVLLLDEVRTGADWAELPQQEAARAERQAQQTPSAVKGLREIMLVYPVDEHREMISVLEGLKRVWGDLRYPQIVARALREAAERGGVVGL